MTEYMEPTPKKRSSTRARRLPIKPNNEFIYVHRDEQWDLVEYAPMSDSGERGEMKLYWLPRLSHQPLVRGVNSIDGDATSRDPSIYIAQVQREGGRAWRAGDPKLGDYSDFVYEVDCVWKGRMGVHYLTPWQTPLVLNGMVEWEVDTLGFRDFLSYLVDSGNVPPMSRALLKRMTDVEKRRLTELTKRAAAAPHLLSSVADCESRIARMFEAYEEQFGSAKPSEPTRVATRPKGKRS